MSDSSFNSILITELPAFISAFHVEGINDPAVMLSTLSFIDDLLTIQRSKSLLNRKHSLNVMLDKRIGLEVDSEGVL